MKINKCLDCNIKSVAAQYLSEDELTHLQNQCASVDFKPGEVIFKQGALSSNIIYIKRGLVKLHIQGPHREQIIKITKSPKYLGIPTTIHEKINQYSATALEPTSVCFIDIETFKNFIYNNGKFAYEIVVDLCQNELKTFKQCVNRTQKQIKGRVAEAILFFSNDIYNNDEFILPLTREEFANLTDTSRESVCKTLNEFHVDKIIELDSKKIKILNRKLLETISEKG